MGIFDDFSKSLPNMTRKPNLKGVTAVITRPEDVTVDYFSKLGANVLWAPATQMASRVSLVLDPLKKALDEANRENGWLILPSPLAVRHFQEAVEKLGRSDGDTTTIRAATIGEGSARQMHRAGWVQVFTPPQPTGESLAATLPIEKGTPVTIAGSTLGRPELREGLKARGARLRVIGLYTPEPNPSGLKLAVSTLSAHPEAVIVVTSPSGVEALWRALADAALSPARVRWAAIGAATRDDLIARGALASRVAMATQPDDEGLARAVAAAAAEKTPSSKNAP